MATTSAPRGFEPVGSLDGRPYSGAVRLYRIKSADAYAIGNGDLVTIIGSGSDRGYCQRINTTLTATTVTSSGTALGVLVGCEYTDPNSGQKTFNHYWPGSITATDIYAHVVDDPDCIFRIQANGAVALTALHCNFSVIQTAVTNTTTKNSGLQLKYDSNATTTTLPIRLIGFDTRPGNTIGDTYTNCLVRINNHLHRTLTGTAAS
jgi:hypothetical protein